MAFVNLQKYTQFMKYFISFHFLKNALYVTKIHIIFFTKILKEMLSW